MRKAFRTVVNACIVSVGLGLGCAAFAQDASNDANRTPPVVAPGPERAPGATLERERGFNPGWLGLAGLAGLLGLMPRDRREPVHGTVQTGNKTTKF
jgi:hypothetical protein